MTIFYCYGIFPITQYQCWNSSVAILISRKTNQFYYQEGCILEAVGYLATASGIKTSFTNKQEKKKDTAYYSTLDQHALCKGF